MHVKQTLKHIIFTAIFIFTGQTIASNGLITIVINDPSNPYWFTEGSIASKTAEDLGYLAHVRAHQGSIENEQSIIEDAVRQNAKAIILDPADTTLSAQSVRYAKQNGIPVFIVNAEINETGLAISQLISDNTQGAKLAAKAWSNAMKYSGEYIELVGAPGDNNAKLRSEAFNSVLKHHDNLNLVARVTGNWSRLESYQAMQRYLIQFPNLKGIISANDEMALGAITALREANRLDDVIVSGFDGSPDAATAIILNDLQFSILQPVADFSKEAVAQADRYIRTRTLDKSEEIQKFSCYLLSIDNIHMYTSAFELSE